MNQHLSRFKAVNLIRASRLLFNSNETDFIFQRAIHTNYPKLISIKTLVHTLDNDVNKFKNKEKNVGHSSDYSQFQISESKLKQYIKEESKYNGKLIYIGGLTRQLKSAKILSLSSSLMGLMLLPFLNTTLSASGLFAKIFVFGTSGFFIFVTPLFSQFLGKRYVSRLFYNYEEKRFTAILFSFLMYEYKLEFKIDDVYVPDVPGPFSTIKLKESKRNLFVDLNQIDDLELVKKIYGYDKPLDLNKYKQKDD